MASLPNVGSAGLYDLWLKISTDGPFSYSGISFYENGE